MKKKAPPLVEAQGNSALPVVADDDLQQYEAQKERLRKASQWLVDGLRQFYEARPKEERLANAWADHRVTVSVGRLIARVDRQIKIVRGELKMLGEPPSTANESIRIFLDAVELVDAVMYACNYAPGIEKSIHILKSKRGAAESVKARRSDMEAWQVKFDPIAKRVAEKEPWLSAKKIEEKVTAELAKVGLANDYLPEAPRLQQHVSALRKTGYLPAKTSKPPVEKKTKKFRK